MKGGSRRVGFRRGTIAFLPFFIVGLFTIVKRELAAPLFAAFVHECGHIAAIVILGGNPGSVRLTPAGARIDAATERMTSAGRVFVYLSGAVANIVTGTIGYLLSAENFAACSFALAIVNLLPVRTLDGFCAAGEIVGEKGARLLEVLSLVTVFVLWILAVIVLLFTGSVSLWLFASYLFVAIYLGKS